MEFSIIFIPVSKKDIFLDYSLIINNIDNQKSEIIKCNETINGEEKKCNVFSKINCSDINSENGFLQEKLLQITCMFHIIDIPQDHDSISTEIQYQTDWHINEDIGDFHTTEDPIKLIIKENTLQFACTFEITEDDTYFFSIFSIDPEFSFKGQLTVILHNQIDSQKDITKITSIQFTPEEFELPPISFDLSQGQLTNKENGWIISDKETNGIISGLHFTIIIYLPENLINRLSRFKIDTEKKLFDSYPIHISCNDGALTFRFSLVIYLTVSQPI